MMKYHKENKYLLPVRKRLAGCFAHSMQENSVRGITTEWAHINKRNYGKN